MAVFGTIILFLIELLCSAYDCGPRHPLHKTGPLTLTRDGRSDKLFGDTSAIVHTRSGTVEGYKGKVLNDRGIFCFEGIPYAVPPIGNLRFRDPIPKNSWTGTRHTKKPGPMCLQPRGFVKGNEDCLYLNVYTPMLPTHENGTSKLSVIVWIHGGSFIIGSGAEYGPYYLLHRDVVLVTINYRLGVLGFMSTGDIASPGNYGLKDQALAIKWVHDNIASFAGDPEKISLAGQSAGAASVHFQMLSTTSVAKGLFQSGISLSGSGFSNWALLTATRAKELTTKLASSFYCPTDSGSQAIVECYRKMDANILVAAQSRLPDVFMFPVVLFGPVIESNASTYPFITDTVENYYERNQVASIPWMSTSTEYEAEVFLLVLKSIALLPSYLIWWKNYMPYVLDLKRGVDNVDFVMDKLVKNYFGDQNPMKADPKIWAQIATDRYYQASLRVALKYHARVAPTYSYLLNFTSRVGVAQVLNDDHRSWGASHSEELSLIFNCSKVFPAIEKGEPAFYMSDIMTNLLTNFVQKGKPYFTNENGSDVIIWEPIKDSGHFQFLSLNSENIKMISDPFVKRLKIWKTLGIY